MNEKDIENRFLEVYDSVADAIFRRCFFKVSDRAIAEDLAQETFVKTWNYIQANPDKQIENLQAFLYTVCNNLIKDYYKKKKALPESRINYFEIDALEDDKPNAVVFAEAAKARELIGKLDDDDQELLILRYVEEWDVKDIAEIKGERPNTISVRIHRAKERFDELLDSLGNDKMK